MLNAPEVCNVTRQTCLVVPDVPLTIPDTLFFGRRLAGNVALSAPPFSNTTQVLPVRYTSIPETMVVCSVASVFIVPVAIRSHPLTDHSADEELPHLASDPLSEV